jgi:GTP cyclohydrolase I
MSIAADLDHPLAQPLHAEPLLRLADRQEKPVDLARIARAVREILAAVGEDPDREGLADTPSRVARSYAELLSGLRDGPERHLSRVFEHEAPGDDLVVVRDIDFQSMCEHHLLPFRGRAHVAYLPAGGKVVGLSKIARTVDVFARRPQLQERLTANVADAIAEHLGARGVAVVVTAEHLCMQLRGARKQQADMVTTAFRGALADDESMKRHAMLLLSGNGF